MQWYSIVVRCGMENGADHGKRARLAATKTRRSPRRYSAMSFTTSRFTLVSP